MQGVERPLSEFNFNLFSDNKGCNYFTTLHSGTYYKLTKDLQIEKTFRFEPSIKDEKLSEPIKGRDKIDELSDSCYSLFYSCRNMDKDYLSLRASYGNRVRDVVYDKINSF